MDKPSSPRQRGNTDSIYDSSRLVTSPVSSPVGAADANSCGPGRPETSAETPLDTEPRIRSQGAAPDPSKNTLLPYRPALPSSPASVHSSSGNESEFSNTPDSVPCALTRLLCSGSDIEFQNSSFLDDTRAQFDLHINLDKPNARRPHEPTCWLLCKPSSPKPLSGTSPYLRPKTNHTALAADINSASRVAELTKLLTDCKIQLRLYEKFLQDLISRQNIDVAGLDFPPRWNAADGRVSLPRTTGDEQEIANISTLVEDLHTSLEECQAKWEAADRRASSLERVLVDWSLQVKDLLTALGCTAELDANLAPDELLAAAAPILSEYLPAAAARVPETDMTDHFQRINLSGADTRPSESSASSRPLGSASTLLDYHRSAYSSNSSHGPVPVQFFLMAPHSDTSAKFREYQEKIDALQREVEMLKEKGRAAAAATAPSAPNPPESPSAALRQQLDRLQAAYDDLSEEHWRAQKDASRAILSLTHEVSSQKRELHRLQAAAESADGALGALETAVETQRELAAQKTRLSRQVEALTREKSTLQKTLQKLAEDTQHDQLLRLARDAELQQQLSAADTAEQLFAADVRHFQKLLSAFDKIADDASLAEPTRKLDALVPMCHALLSQPPDSARVALSYHRSVFAFFAKAVDVIVRDHIRLLLRHEKEGAAHRARTEQLNLRVTTLEQQIRDEKDAPSVSRFRIEELTSRWKAEREARVSESRAARRRMGELRL